MAIPILGFRGSPTGIDVLKVARTGWLPQINTGMAGRVAGTGQVGAGIDPEFTRWRRGERAGAVHHPRGDVDADAALEASAQRARQPA